MAAKNRIVTVDALRGFALLGIMLVHFLFWHTAGPLPENVFNKYNDVGSSITKTFTDIFLSGKFFAFFSFLFGLSFYLQTGEEKGKVVLRFAWRITLLLLIGLVHHAFWMGDILSIYAPLGFLLLLSRKLNNKWTLIIGLLLVINLPGKIAGFMQFFSQPQLEGPGKSFDFSALANEYNKVITTGSWWDIFKYNLRNIPTKFAFQIESGRLYITMGFFLLGMFVGRKKWFEIGEEARSIWQKLCKRSATIGGACFLIGLVLIVWNQVFKLGLEQNRYIGFLFSFLFDILSVAMVIFYVSGLTLLMFKNRGQRFLSTLAPVGKMALTSYLIQTFFGLLLFWSVGLGLYSKTSPGLNGLIAIAFFTLQVHFSKWWLGRYNFGPAEWLWRSGTMLKAQPMVRKKIKLPVQEGQITTISKEPVSS